MKNKRMKPIISNFTLSICSLFMFLFLAETIARMFQVPTQIFRDGPNIQMYEDSPEYFWRLRPFFKGVHRNVLLPEKAKMHNAVSLEINSLGLRGREISISKPRNTKRIIVMGNSTTFGYSVSRSKSYVGVLENMLKEQGYDDRVEVINAGVPGYSSFQGLLFWKGLVKKLNPDILVLAFVGINDLQNRNITDRQLWNKMSRYIGLKKILYQSYFYLSLRKFFLNNVSRSQLTSDDGHRIIHIRSPLNEYEKNLETIALEAISKGSKVVFVFIPIRRMLNEDRDDSMKTPEEFDARAFSLCQRAVSIINNNNENISKALPLLEESLNIQDNISLAHKMLSIVYKRLGNKQKSEEHASKANEINGINIWDYRDTMEKVSKKLGLPFVNTIEPLKESSSNNFNSLFLEAIHPNIKGHKIIARELLPELLRMLES